MEITGRIELVVRDLKPSARFYEDGLDFRRELKRKAEAGGRAREYLPLRDDDILLMLDPFERLSRSHPLVPRSQGERAGIGAEFCFSLIKDELSVWYNRARAAGDHVMHRLVARPWGACDIRMLDPDTLIARVSGRDIDQRLDAADVGAGTKDASSAQLEA